MAPKTIALSDFCILSILLSILSVILISLRYTKHKLFKTDKVELNVIKKHYERVKHENSRLKTLIANKTELELIEKLTNEYKRLKAVVANKDTELTMERNKYLREINICKWKLTYSSKTEAAGIQKQFEFFNEILTDDNERLIADTDNKDTKLEKADGINEQYKTKNEKLKGENQRLTYVVANKDTELAMERNKYLKLTESFQVTVDVVKKHYQARRAQIDVQEDYFKDLQRDYQEWIEVIDDLEESYEKLSDKYKKQSIELKNLKRSLG